MRYFTTVIILSVLFKLCAAQKPENKQVQLLDSLSVSMPALNQPVDISVSDISIKELVRILGNSTGLNVSVDPGVDRPVSSNFAGVTAKDVIHFLSANYNLKPEVYGHILYLKPVVDDGRKLLIDFNPADSLLSYTVVNIPSKDFFEELTRKTNINFILNPGIAQAPVNSFGQEITFTNALLQISAANNLSIQKNDAGLFIVSPPLKADAPVVPPMKVKPLSMIVTNGLVSVSAADFPIFDLLKNLESQSNYSCCFLNPVPDKISLNLKNYDLKNFLNSVFTGTGHTYRIENDCIFIGSRKLPEIKSCEIFKLNNRRVDSLSFVLPKEYTKDLSVKEFFEQNSFIAWGDADRICQFKKIIKEIDVPVPVILIDVIIVDSSKRLGLETGLEAGLGEEPAQTKGTVNEGLDMTMGAGSVNNLMDRAGLSNLGKVSPNFYLKLKAMETNDIIDIRSTPQLSTLNGHSASLSIGQTEYYQEETQNIWGTQDPQLVTQKMYKPVEAKLQIIIRPFVTGNGQVSMDISVIQSEFTTRISEFAPPGLVSREFKSKISVKNQDMVLLGGLEENNTNKSSKGWPLLSRVPVLKWIFSSKNDTHEKSQLNIFIKPTVFY
ncbi:MAG: hypothetical protein PHI28_07555 [Mangrovibacterium sp.]|nr:hypothetical protein [Mangrovibacterium sp.]